MPKIVRPEDRLDNQVFTRLTDIEKAKAVDRAKRMSISVSAWIRYLVRRAR